MTCNYELMLLVAGPTQHAGVIHEQSHLYTHLNIIMAERKLNTSSLVTERVIISYVIIKIELHVHNLGQLLATMI